MPDNRTTRQDLIDFCLIIGNQQERLAELYGMTDAEFEALRDFEEEQAIKDRE